MFSTFLAFNGDREVIAAVAQGRTGATETTPAPTRPSRSAPSRRPASIRLRTRLDRPVAAPRAPARALVTTPRTTRVPDYDREPARAC